MPTYEFKCPTHGVFEQDFRMADMPASLACGECGEESPKILSLFGNISTSDDPSFGSGRGTLQNRNHEFSGFDADTKHGWAERPTHSKSDWEYA